MYEQEHVFSSLQHSFRVESAIFYVANTEKHFDGKNSFFGSNELSLRFLLVHPGKSLLTGESVFLIVFISIISPI